MFGFVRLQTLWDTFLSELGYRIGFLSQVDGFASCQGLLLELTSFFQNLLLFSEVYIIRRHVTKSFVIALYLSVRLRMVWACEDVLQSYLIDVYLEILANQARAVVRKQSGMRTLGALSSPVSSSAS